MHLLMERDDGRRVYRTTAGQYVAKDTKCPGVVWLALTRDAVLRMGGDDAWKLY